ncbi:tyrosinase family protein [Pseudomonas sp. ABC1]|uniref:tyrosinase family protein n=1 Tax=Pseudomonas sp. ABC1 TaxID=2748080 RepID=UPI0015C3010D|nr:tyrosinase family protein [Pseudomonas sp. ABC1]QLF92557.1 tyrosinase family protein [Pseudomonas sp. ABC1]
MKKALSIGIVASAMVMSAYTQAQQPATPEASATSNATGLLYVRKSAHSPDAKGDLQALELALKKMRALGCADPRSWYYQGATHAIPATIPNGDNPLCPSYTEISKLKWGWNTCTHQDGSEIHFLVWHRIYIQHFESIVRTLSGKADFALPYWDYTNPANRTLPAALRDSASSLYAEARLPSLNEGRNISAEMDKALDTTTLFQNRVFAAFNSQIDAAPHGAMHVYIGGQTDHLTMWNPIYRTQTSGLMALVPSAGFDPVFWLHHANIDYLWQKWENSSNGVRPTLDELQAVPWPYQFYNGDGKRHEYTIPEAYKAAFNPNYVYDQLRGGIAALDSQKHTRLLQLNQQRNDSKRVLWSEKPGQLVKGGKLELALPQATKARASVLSAQAASAPLVLQLTVSFTKEPEDTYEVYTVDAGGTQKLAGLLTFFGAGHHAGFDSGSGHSHAHEGQKTFLLDVSDELEPKGDYRILIKKQREPVDEITVKEVSLLSY